MALELLEHMQLRLDCYKVAVGMAGANRDPDSVDAIAMRVYAFVATAAEPATDRDAGSSRKAPNSKR